MDKKDFIDILKNHSSNAKIFNNRFECISNDGNKWEYSIPAVDIIKPLIDLTIDNTVIYYPNTDFNLTKFIKMSYEEIIQKFNLIK